MERSRFDQALSDYGAGFWGYTVARAELHAGGADRRRRRELRRKMQDTHGLWLAYVRAMALDDPPSAAERKAARMRARIDGGDAA